MTLNAKPRSDSAILEARKYLSPTQLFLFECMRFVDWAAGEGIGPAKGRKTKDPANIIERYCEDLDKDKFELIDMYELAIALNGHSPDIPAPIGAPITFTYKNWRGEVARRTVTPAKIWYGSSQHHPEPQWFLRGFDHQRKAERDFAMRDMGPADLENKIFELSRQFKDVATAFREGVDPAVLNQSRAERVAEASKLLQDAFSAIGAALLPLAQLHESYTRDLGVREPSDAPHSVAVKWEDLERAAVTYRKLDQVLETLHKPSAAETAATS